MKKALLPVFAKQLSMYLAKEGLEEAGRNTLQREGEYSLRVAYHLCLF